MPDRHRIAPALVFLLLTGALLAPCALAGSVPLEERSQAGALDLEQIAAQLPDRAADPLEPFRLHIGASVPDVERIVPLRTRGYVRAKQDVYLHGIVGGPEADGSLPAPSGLSVLEGDLYFRDGGELVEASMILSADDGTERAIVALESVLGSPDFEVVMPGALELAIGWRAGQGFLLATFTDLPIFRVHAFMDDPRDLLAGTHLLLFEGLSRYAEQLAAGAPREEIDAQLGQLLAWVRMARRALEEGR